MIVYGVLTIGLHVKMNDQNGLQIVFAPGLGKKEDPMNRVEICKKVMVVVIGLGIMMWVRGAPAQEYPTKPINLLICMQPGAGLDVGVRIIAQEATKTLGQEVVPVNKPGGGGSVAAGILASSKGDGYTLMACTNGCLTNIPHLESVPYDPLKDVTPIIQFGQVITGIVVRSDSPYKSFKEFIDGARKNPGKLTYGFPGVGTAPHLAIEHVMLEDKVDISTVPFDGAVPAVTALLGGHVTACGISTSGFLQHLKAGKVKVLAITGDKRISVVPDVPTLYELGYPYGVLVDLYYIAAPKGIPPAAMQKVEGAVLKAMETQGFRTLAESLYMQVQDPLHGQKFKEYIEALHAKNGDIIRKSKLGK
jgi:tripartite-type tricarboxylate transporter receptor subunit TctC